MRNVLLSLHSRLLHVRHTHIIYIYIVWRLLLYSVSFLYYTCSLRQIQLSFADSLSFLVIRVFLYALPFIPFPSVFLLSPCIFFLSLEPFYINDMTIAAYRIRKNFCWIWNFKIIRLFHSATTYIHLTKRSGKKQLRYNQNSQVYFSVLRIIYWKNNCVCLRPFFFPEPAALTRTLNNRHKLFWI